MELFFFGIIHDGKAHSDGCCCSNAPKFSQPLNYFDDGIFVYFWY
jgi:hypothetical protein